MGVHRKVFYPVAFSAMLFASSAMAKINPTAFIGVTDFFLKDKSKNINMEFYSPTLGEVALETGLIENIRFHGPFEAGSKDGERDYTADSSKDPLWNVVKILFPSVNGQLGTVTGATTNFAKHVKDPIIVALLLNYAKKVEDLPEKSFLKKQITADFAQYIANTVKLETKERQTFINVVTLLLNGIRKSIEVEKAGKSLYPRHTTEQIIEAFFCYQFNTQDDIWKLIEHLDKSIVDKTKPVPTQSHYLEEKDLPNIAKKADDKFNLDDLFDLANASLFTSLTPYKAGVNLLNNGTTNFYDRANDTYIKNKTMQDCVETTMRHICNLLLFNSEVRVRDFDLSFIQGFVTKQEATTSLNNPYFKNFQKFYEVQKLLQANAGDIGTRSLWNTVVGNLPNTAYVQDGSNEIKSGFVNLLKTFDTIFSLSLKDPPTAGLDAKKSWVEESLRTLFSALNPVYDYTVNLEGSEFGNELIGNARVTVANKGMGEKLFSFNLDVRRGHAEVNQLTNLKKQGAIDYTKDIKNHLHAVKTGTAEESLLLLASPELQQELHPFYKLYSQPLSDNASKINFLKELDINYASWKNLPSFKNNLPLIQSMVKNVLNGIGWDDPEIVKQIMPVIMSLLENADLEAPVGFAVRSLQSTKLSWVEISSLAKKLPNLNHLNLSKNQKLMDVLFTNDFKFLKKLNFFSSSVEKIETLDTLPNLEELDLGSTKNLKEISLKELKNLRTLILWGSSITKIDGLETLSKLEDLNISFFTKLEGISVRELKNLKKLSVSGGSFNKIEGLETLSNLETLDIDDTKSFGEMSVKGFKNLQNLKFTGDEFKFEKIALERLPRLQDINLTDVGLEDLRELVLKDLPNVMTLNLGGSGVEDIKGLETLSNLKKLNLSRTAKLEKVSVGGLTELETLSFVRSSIKTIEGLETLSSLQRLNLKGTKNFKDLSFTSVLNGLNELDLENSNVSALKGLSLLPNLKKLNLKGAQEIQEVEFTQDNKELKILLKDSGIKNRNQIKGIEHLDEGKIEW